MISHIRIYIWFRNPCNQYICIKHAILSKAAITDKYVKNKNKPNLDLIACNMYKGIYKSID